MSGMNLYRPINLVEIATRNAARLNNKFDGYEETKGDSIQERVQRIYSGLPGEIETPNGVRRADSLQSLSGRGTPN